MDLETPESAGGRTFDGESTEGVCVTVIIVGLTHVLPTVVRSGPRNQERVDSVHRPQEAAGRVDGDLAVVVDPVHVDGLATYREAGSTGNVQRVVTCKMRNTFNDWLCALNGATNSETLHSGCSISDTFE